jgi:prepilin-type N-terminal cleavage/methylation domain-containing protein
MKKVKGFTLIELLVVISIIVFLSSIVLASLSVAREKAKIARAQSDLIEIRNAILLMRDDTGAWPKGCESRVFDIPNEGEDNEIALNDPQAGLSHIRPTVTSTGKCQWLSEEVAAWNGPYIPSNFKDPWGNFYWFDNDYAAYEQADFYQDTQNCTGLNPTDDTIAVVVSFGPSGTKEATAPFTNLDEPSGYDCDDIFVQLW